MSAKMNTRTSVQSIDPLQHPCNGQRDSQAPARQAQGELNFSTVGTWIEDVYLITREVARDHFGDDALASDMKISRQLMQLKLNRREDSNKQTQRLHLDVLGHIFNDSAARWNWLVRFTALCHAKPPVALNEPTDSEKLAMLLGALDGEAGEAILDRAAAKNGVPKQVLRRAR